MGTAFPGALDGLTNPSAGQTLLAGGHLGLHGDVNDAVEAIEAKVGISASTPVADRLLLGTGTGTSAWSTAATVKTSLGLVIGTNVQAWDADLDTLASTYVGATAWTPALTFATPGDVAATYNAQTGSYFRIGPVVFFWIDLVLATFTHTTASGNLRIAGLPTAAAVSMAAGGLVMTGWALANYTMIELATTASQTYLETLVSGSGQAVSQLTTAHVATGQGANAIRLYAVGQYRV